MLKDICTYPENDDVVAIPYVIPENVRQKDLPAKLKYKVEASGSKLNYIWHNLSSFFKVNNKPDVIICEHIVFSQLAGC